MEAQPKRKKGRLTGYDYSANGSYYITVCTKDKQHILGHSVGGGVLDAPYVRLSKYGAMVRDALLEMDTFYDDITINHYVIMPNHIHFILSICGEGGRAVEDAGPYERIVTRPRVVEDADPYECTIASFSLCLETAHK